MRGQGVVIEFGLTKPVRVQSVYVHAFENEGKATHRSQFFRC
jgi:hypothetical protein